MSEKGADLVTSEREIRDETFYWDYERQPIFSGDHYHHRYKR